jgi:uncharacterized protein YggE
MAVGLVGLAGTSAFAQDSNARAPEPRTITALGTGIVEGVPDVLELSLGVSTRERSAADALSRNSALARKVMFVLKSAGVADKDVQTTGLSISPAYDDDGEHVVGYEVSNTVAAQIHAIDDAGKIVDAATKVAGDDIVVNSLYFSFDDNSKLVSAARSDAVKRAKAQAQQLAGAAGVELGDLMTISESGTPTGPPVPMPESREGAAGDAAPPINPGTETTSVDVTLVYEIQ